MVPPFLRLFMFVRFFLLNSLKPSWQPFVFVREDAVIPTLAPRYRGPHFVLDRQSKYFRLQIGSKQDSVSVDCLKPAFNDDLITTFALRKTSPPPHGVFF